MKKHIVLIGLVLILSACVPSSSQPTPPPDLHPTQIEESTLVAPTNVNEASQTSIPTQTIPAASEKPHPSPSATLDPELLPTATLLPGPAPSLPPREAVYITNGDRQRRNVALTFDIGEKPESPAWYDEDIETVLNEYQAAATFFLGGHWMQRYPQVTRRLAANPRFEVGNHSWAHPDFPDLSYPVISEELLKTNDVFYQLTGRVMDLFRFPAGLNTPYVQQVVADHGFIMVQWDVVTADPVPDNDADNINRIVRERVQNGSIIVMHANGRGWHTAEALPEMINWLRTEGYNLVTLSKLLDP